MKKTIKVLEEITNGFKGELILSGFHHKSNEAMELKKYVKYLRKAIKVLKSVKKEPKEITVFVNAFKPIKEKP